MAVRLITTIPVDIVVYKTRQEESQLEDLLGGGNEFHGNAIDTIAEPSGFGSVFKDMAEVSAAAGAMDFRAWIEFSQQVIGGCTDIIGMDGLEKAGPPGSGVKLMGGYKQLQVTPGAGVCALTHILEYATRERPFRVVLSHDFIRFGGQTLFPFGIG